jgi:hypothetical protein
MELTMAQAGHIPSAIPDLAELHGYQSSPAGMIAAHVVDLVSTVAELEKLADNPVHFRLIAAELADLHLVHSELEAGLRHVLYGAPIEEAREAAIDSFEANACRCRGCDATVLRATP